MRCWFLGGVALRSFLTPERTVTQLAWLSPQRPWTTDAPPWHSARDPLQRVSLAVHPGPRRGSAAGLHPRSSEAGLGVCPVAHDQGAMTAPATVEDREVARLLTDVERARAGLDAAFDALELAVARAVVEAGASWSQVALLALGDAARRDTARRDFGDAVALYREVGGLPRRGEVVGGFYGQVVAGLVASGEDVDAWDRLTA